jgi:hypothetical protein
VLSRSYERHYWVYQTQSRCKELTDDLERSISRSKSLAAWWGERKYILWDEMKSRSFYLNGLPGMHSNFLLWSERTPDGGYLRHRKETTTNRCLDRSLCRFTDRDRRILRSSLTPSKEKHTQIPLGFYLRSVENFMSHGCLANIMYTCLDSDRSLWRH